MGAEARTLLRGGGGGGRYVAAMVEADEEGRTKSECDRGDLE